jgi:hypothetical protein
VQVRSAKRGLSSGSRAIALPSRLAVLGTAGLFAAIVAPIMLGGAAWAPLGRLMPMLNANVAAAIGIFLLMTLVWLLLVYIATALSVARARKTA